MFLRKFTLTGESGRLIREVTFKKGMNIILGECGEGNGQSSNSLGKTTLIRCLDFCLGGKDATAIYTDSEFKKENKTVVGFLKKEKPTFKLTLSNRFDSTDEIIIERHLDLTAARNRITNYINGERYTQKEFYSKLKELLFGFAEAKPTLRELLGKFIRQRDNQLEKILYFNGNFCKNVEYEKIHLFLFGFNQAQLLTEKSEVEQKQRSIENALSVLEKRNSVSSLEQKISLIESELHDLESLRDAFNISDKYDEEAAQLENIQIQLNQNEKLLAEQRLKRDGAAERISRLEHDAVSANGNTLKYLYEEASFYNEQLAKTFNEVVNFHNTMLENEIAFLKKSIRQSDACISELENRRSDLADEYNRLLVKLGQSGSLREYTKLNDRIAAKSREKGEAYALLEELNHYIGESEELKKKYDSIIEEMNKTTKLIDENLKVFNSYFSKNTEKLTGKKYFLSYSIIDGIYKFQIEEINHNPGTGEKQAVVMAFDLAYMAFCNEMELKRPLFATQDKIEVVDIRKITMLFNLANQQNGQLITPVIDDKIKDYPDLVKDTVLSLNSEDKFFRIESR
jgi:hypothetical protein